MSYIGREPAIGNYQVCDALTASATATYALAVGGSSVSPESANHMIVSLNGVIQKPVGSFTVSGSNIVFNSALTSSDSIDFIILLGSTLDVGIPSDASITNAKLASDVISGETDIGAGLADADLSLVDDGAGGTLRKCAMSRVKTYTGGGKLLQIQATQLQAEFSTSSTSFTDVTNMAVTITPSATDSKILLLCNTNTLQNTDTAYWAMRWERAISGGATTNIGHGTYGLSFARSAQANDFWGGVGMTYLDSPSTTSAVTYQVQASTTGSGSLTIGVNTSSTNSVYALEIGA